MILTERKVPFELMYMRAFSKRIDMGSKDVRILAALESGYEGELHYDRVLEEAGHGTLIIFRDIYLKAGDGVAQFDSIMIDGNSVTVNEIKNYSGFYSYVDGQWFSGKFEVTEDAISQLKRAMGKLKKVRYDSQMNFDVSGKIIFPNLDLQFDCDDERARSMIIMRNQMKDYLKGFRSSGISEQSKEIARVIYKRIIENPYFDKAADIEDLKLGLYCRSCDSFDLDIQKYYVYCRQCRCRESKESHIIRALSDFQALFRHEKMTRQKLQMLLGNQISERMLQRMLKKYCETFSTGVSIYYKFKYYDYDEAVKKEPRKSKYSLAVKHFK